MADSPNRPNYGSLSNRSTTSRRSRPSMRVPSARSSAAYDDYPSHLHPHALRSVSSRFSLGDFAATRSEFDFDDDASSIFERATLASEAGDVAGDKFEAAAAGLGADLVDESGQTVIGDENYGERGSAGDYYDLLCLPRDPFLAPHRIRRAYWRLLALLLSDNLPEDQRPLAATHLAEAQQAFETLIDPARRANYDERLRAWLDRDDEVQEGNHEHLYEDALADHLWLASQRRAFSSSAVGIRVDASPVIEASRQPGSRKVFSRPLDFGLSHSVTTALPGFGRLFRSEQPTTAPVIAAGEQSLPHSRATGALTELTATSDIYLPAPELTISGSAYGLFDRAALPALLSDQYHPFGPLLTSRGKLVYLAKHTFSPGVKVNLRQDVLRRTVDDGVSRSSIQLECEPLNCGLGACISHEVSLGGKPLTIETSFQSPQACPRTPSQVGVGLRYPVSSGVAFITADSGDWKFSREEGAGTLLAEQLLAGSGDLGGLGLPLGASPTLEVGFATASARASTAAERCDPHQTSVGICGLDHETDGLGVGSWAASASLTPSSAAGSLRYSRDVSYLGLMLSRTDSRIEVELASNTLYKQHLAVRNLWRVGVHAKVGIEIGLGSDAFHMSLYWSRLKHRLSLPLLLSSPGMSASANVIFWTGVLPFLALAGMQYFSAQTTAAEAVVSRAKTAEEIGQRVTRKRAEADELVTLLADPVEAKQQLQREREGLVILEARYGVKATLEDGSGSLWNAEQVADVTVATAALVDDQGRLVIPAGVRKSGLLGFWDPAPGSVKVLQVRYAYGGKEGVVDVKGRRALVLPPMKDDV
ncbi:hypothetical protein ACHAQA_000422 [Verticillium albo-atrum]